MATRGKVRFSCSVCGPICAVNLASEVCQQASLLNDFDLQSLNPQVISWANQNPLDIEIKAYLGTGFPPRGMH